MSDSRAPPHGLKRHFSWLCQRKNSHPDSGPQGHPDLHLNNRENDPPTDPKWHPMRRKSVASYGRKLTSAYKDQ